MCVGGGKGEGGGLGRQVRARWRRLGGGGREEGGGGHGSWGSVRVVSTRTVCLAFEIIRGDQPLDVRTHALCACVTF